MTIPSIQATPSHTPQPAAQKTVSATTASGIATAASNATATPGATAATTTEQGVDATRLTSAIEKVQDVTKTLANELRFSIDEYSGHTVVKIVDTATDEVIRQMPSEEMLAIAEALDQIQGLLFKQKA